jgi:hypothetical protein
VAEWREGEWIQDLAKAWRPEKIGRLFAVALLPGAVLAITDTVSERLAFVAV